jgi:hypothetical protein
MIRTTIVTAAGLAFVTVLSAAPAQAQRDRVFVASYGSDSNPCTFGSPCKTFQQAVNVVAQGGEVTAIDSAGFGPISISHSVTITSPAGVEAGIVPVKSHAAIDINAGSTDKIILRGLTLNGSGVELATGIRFNAGSNLIVQNCVIENFESTGLLVVPNSSSSTFSVSDTQVVDNLYGIYISPSGTGMTRGVLNHVDVENNTLDGITFNTPSQTIFAIITDSVSAQNGRDGVVLTSSGSNAIRTTVYVRNSSILNNYQDGVDVTNNFAYVLLTRSMIQGNTLGYSSPDGSPIFSYGDNSISEDDEPNPTDVPYDQ